METAAKIRPAKKKNAASPGPKALLLVRTLKEIGRRRRRRRTSQRRSWPTANQETLGRCGGRGREEEDTSWRWGRGRVAKEAELEAAGHLARARVGS